MLTVFLYFCASYQVRFGLLQAAHYGTPQTRVRFFLMAAKMGLPLPELPVATHDFPLVDSLEMKFPNEDNVRPLALCTITGRAFLPHVRVWDAIGDLHAWEW